MVENAVLAFGMAAILGICQAHPTSPLLAVALWLVLLLFVCWVFCVEGWSSNSKSGWCLPEETM